MDPAEQQQALASKAVLLGRHEQVILLDNMAVLSQRMCRLAVPGVYTFPATGPAVAASVSADSYVCDPEPFHGNLDHCWGFLLQCMLVFTQRSRHFALDGAKVIYVIGLLRGRALAWAQASGSGTPLNSLPFHKFALNGFLTDPII